MIVTLLGGRGTTGVETHLNEIQEEARGRGYATLLVTPYTGPRIYRLPFRVLKNRRGERATVSYRLGQAWLIKRQLLALRRKYGSTAVTLYAQCPLSAKAALAVSSSAPQWRTMLVVHFNVSEASEVVEKGLAAVNGPWVRHLDALELRVLPRVDKLFFVSDYMRRIVMERVVGAKNVPCETLFNFPPVPEVDQRAPVGDLVSIGTLEPRKNQAFLLDVLAEAKKRGRVYSLAIFGDGPDRQMLEDKAVELGLVEQIRFLGFQRNASALMSRYRCLAHAARRENCPLCVIESLSHGRPVLAAAVGGIPELFTDGTEGVFWDLGNVPLAAEMLIGVLDSPAQYAQMSAAAKLRYERVFAPLAGRWISALTDHARGIVSSNHVTILAPSR